MKKQIELHKNEMTPIQILAVNFVLDLARERTFLVVFCREDNVGLSETIIRSSPLSEELQINRIIIAETWAVSFMKFLNCYTLVLYLFFYHLLILTNMKTISFQLHFKILTDQFFISVIPV